MFGKGDQERINDTLAVITNAPYLDNIIRPQIVTFVSNQFPRLTGPDRQTYRTLSRNMSVKEHMAPGVAAGTAADREKRRAIYLIWSALGQFQQCSMSIRPKADAAMTMGVGGLNAALEEAMTKAAVVASVAGAQHVFNMLNDHPVRFLAANRLIIYGTATGQNKFQTGAPMGAGYQNVMNFHFQYDASDDRFFMQAAAATAMRGQSHQFATVSVPAVHWSNVPGVGAHPGTFTGILGCELAGAAFMLTTQFTGCAFNWTSHGGVVRASHLSPAGGGPTNYLGGGNALAARVAAAGQMANAGGTACVVFGGGAGNAAPPLGGNPFYPDTTVTAIRWVTIIGVIKHGAWRLYTQVVDGNSAIAEARRIM
jgi:hypothetical protein